MRIRTVAPGLLSAFNLMETMNKIKECFHVLIFLLTLALMVGGIIELYTEKNSMIDAFCMLVCVDVFMNINRG